MIGLLAGIRANVATLVSRLTSGRATNLDNLDAAISTRAPASTALSSATWTSTRAAALDSVGIKKVTWKTHTYNNYTGGFSTDAVTLSPAVADTTKTFINASIRATGGSDNNFGWGWAYKLTSTSNINLYLWEVGTSTGKDVNLAVEFQIIEFN